MSRGSYGRAGRLGLIVMHLFKEYTWSTTTDIGRLGLRDIHNRIKDERIIYSVHVHVWHADCEQNVHPKATKRLWINFVSVIFKKMDIKIRKSLDISAKFTTKSLNTFFSLPQKFLKALQLMNKFKAWNEWVNTWRFRQFKCPRIRKRHELALQG